MSQTDLCAFFGVFPKAMEDLHCRGKGFLNGFHLFGARNRDSSHQDFANGATRGCSGTFHYLGESKNLVVELLGVTVKVPPFFREWACAKGMKTGAELILERGHVQRDGHEVHPRRRDPCLRQLFTDAKKSLMALVAGS